MNCQNCNSKNVENYCPNCGQIKVISRITFADLIKDLLGNLSNFESTFFKTIKYLIIKPRIIITDYINGKRKSYFNPIKILLLVLTVKTILEIKIINNDTKTEQSLADELINGDYWKLIFIFIFIPFFSFFSKILFKKYNYSYAEYLIINSYLFSITSLFTIVIYIFKILFFENLNSGTSSMVISFITLNWLYINIFNKSIIKTILKTTLIYILTYSLISIALIYLAKLYN